MKARRIKTVIIVILVIANLIAWGMVSHIHFRYIGFQVKPIPLTAVLLPDKMEVTLTKSTAKELIKDIYDTPHFYFEVNIKEEGKISDASPLLRVVRMRKDADLVDFIVGYAHELSHIKYLTKNETFVSYKTFVHLYESGYLELQYIAVDYANEILGGGYKGTDYDCGYYIMEYLREHNFDYLENMEHLWEVSDGR